MSRKAILIALFVTFSITLLYAKYAMPIYIMSFGIATIFLFFLGLQYYSKAWDHLSQRRFERKMFFTSMFLRILFVLHLYLLTNFFDPGSWPFEIAASDSNLYNDVAKELATKSFDSYNQVLTWWLRSRSDYGYPIYQSLIYKLFGPYTFPVRFINCIWSSITVLLISRIARILFSDKHAKFTGIIAMLMPPLMFYCGLQLKETLMILLVTIVFYNAIKLNEKRKISIPGILMMTFSAAFLFYFRTFMAVIIVISVLSYFALGFLRSGRSIILLLVFFVGINVLYTNIGLGGDVSAQYQDSQNDYLSRALSSKASMAGVSYKQAVIIPFIMAGSTITPFPSFLFTEERQLNIIADFQNELVRNLMYFFYFAGLLIVIRKYFRKSIILIFFLAGYIFALVIGGSSFQERFQLPTLPFVIILMSVGIVNINKRVLTWWNVYLVFIVMAEFAWTFFKLSLRSI
jgi:hypothetical protein